MRIGFEATPTWVVCFVVATAVSAASPCEARNSKPPHPETGYPSYLINRPTCTAGDLFDEWVHCRKSDWPQARSRRSID